MKFKLSIVMILSSIILVNAQKSWKLVDAVGSKIPLGPEKENLVDRDFQKFLSPSQLNVEKIMNRVLAYADSPLKSYQPESPLSNLSADIYKAAASSFLGQKVDLAVSNMGGLRSNIPAGDITLRTVYEVMPFKNELEIVWIKGKYITELMNNIAADGGQGVSGIRFKIKNGAADDILINGLSVQPEKVYTVATNNYLAEGNDHMLPLTKRSKIVHTGKMVRELLVEYLINETAAGRTIHSETDGRISK